LTPLKLTTALWLLCFAVSLTGCQARPVTKLTQVKQTIPAELLQCHDHPLRPGPNATQRTVALILDEYGEALDDCKRKLGAVSEIAMEPK
jgi:hypothetical protein